MPGRTPRPLTSPFAVIHCLNLVSLYTAPALSVSISKLSSLLSLIPHFPLPGACSQAGSLTASVLLWDAPTETQATIPLCSHLCPRGGPGHVLRCAHLCAKPFTAGHSWEQWRGKHRARDAAKTSLSQGHRDLYCPWDHIISGLKAILMLAIGYADPLPMLKSPLQSPLLSDHPLQPDPSGPGALLGPWLIYCGQPPCCLETELLCRQSLTIYISGFDWLKLPPGTKILFSPTNFLTHGKLQIVPCVPVSGRREMNLKKNNQ